MLPNLERAKRIGEFSGRTETRAFGELIIDSAEHKAARPAIFGLPREMEPRKGREAIVHPNEELARREFDLVQAGDLAALDALYANGCVVHYPGKTPLAGSHGVDEFRSRFQALFKEGALTRELHDASGSDDHAVQILELTASVGGRSHTWYTIASMHVQEGQFSEIWLYVDDQYALDDFLNSMVV
jgi:ketosteroid isomerase-like protein